MNIKDLTERDICSKFINPALEQAGWDLQSQIREEVSLTAGRIIVRGKLHTRAKHKRADYVLFYKPNIPLAVIEAKDSTLLRMTVGVVNRHLHGYRHAFDDNNANQFNLRKNFASSRLRVSPSGGAKT